MGHRLPQLVPRRPRHPRHLAVVVRPVPIGDARPARGCVRVSVTAPRRLRREPPAFREVEVRRVERLSPRLVRVTLSGSELAGFTVEQPAASVRVLLPSSGAGDLVAPSWNGNEFLLPDGRRPTI
ncbi:MAG: hypothetical protein E6G14_17935, partial [Actinobacteria bacterium]